MRLELHDASDMRRLGIGSTPACENDICQIVPIPRYAVIWLDSHCRRRAGLIDFVFSRKVGALRRQQPPVDQG